MKSFLITSVLALSLTAHAAPGKKEAPKAMPIDLAKSEVVWTGRKAVVKSSHTGTVKLKSGEVTLDKGQPVAGEFVIDMTTITNTDLQGSPKKADLEGHLKNADFFDVNKFPTATMKMTSVKALTKPASGQPTHEVSGTLTIKGETHPITFPATISTQGNITMAKADLKIDRTLWNVRYASDKFFKSLGDKVIANEIEFSVNLVTVH